MYLGRRTCLLNRLRDLLCDSTFSFDFLDFHLLLDLQLLYLVLANLELFDVLLELRLLSQVQAKHVEEPHVVFTDVHVFQQYRCWYLCLVLYRLKHERRRDSRLVQSSVSRLLQLLRAHVAVEALFVVVRLSDFNFPVLELLV